MAQAQIEEQTEDLTLPPNVSYEAPEEVAAAPEPEPEVDWKAKAEEAEKARNGILRDLQDERRANRERDSKLEELRQAILDRTPAGDSEPDPAPPSKDEPVAYLDHRIGELQRRLDALGTLTVEQRQTAEQRAEQERMQEAAQRFQLAINESARRKAQELPDYPEAVKYGVNLLKEHFGAQGLSGGDLDRAVATELYGVAFASLRNGRDPATDIYESVKRFGYQPKAGDAQEPAKKPAPARSLSNVGGASGSKAKVTMQDFLAMPEKDQCSIAMDEDKFRQLTTQGFVYA